MAVHSRFDDLPYHERGAALVADIPSRTHPTCSTIQATGCFDPHQQSRCSAWRSSRCILLQSDEEGSAKPSLWHATTASPWCRDTAGVAGRYVTVRCSCRSKTSIDHSNKEFYWAMPPCVVNTTKHVAKFVLFGRAISEIDIVPVERCLALSP
jgi:hypothetical protein